MGLNMPPWQQSAAVAHSLALYCYLASAALCRTPPAREEAEMTLELTLAPSGAAVATPRHRLAPHFYPAPFQILPHRLQGHSHSTGICRRADAEQGTCPKA